MEVFNGVVGSLECADHPITCCQCFWIAGEMRKYISYEVISYIQYRDTRVLNDSLLDIKPRSKLQCHDLVEAEYQSMAATCYEITWLKYILHDLGIKHSHLVKLYCDNQAALQIASNPVIQERTKHIEIDSRWNDQNGSYIHYKSAGRDFHQIIEFFTVHYFTWQVV